MRFKDYLKRKGKKPKSKSKEAIDSRTTLHKITPTGIPVGQKRDDVDANRAGIGKKYKEPVLMAKKGKAKEYRIPKPK